VGRLHRTYEVKIGRKVPKSTIYRLLHRQGWRKLAPRGKHPEGNEQAIGQFKKLRTARRQGQKESQLQTVAAARHVSR
jgi:transposase